MPHKACYCECQQSRCLDLGIDFQAPRYLDTIRPHKSIFEFAIPTQKIRMLSALATQSHAISRLGASGRRLWYMGTP